MRLIEPKVVSAERRFFCVYSGRDYPDRLLNDEHVIPLSLGGTRATVIRSLKSLNSRFGTEIDAKIANDCMIQFGRRDAKAKGNSRKLPVPILKGAAEWRRGDSWDKLEPRYNIQVPADGQLISRYDTRTGKFLASGVERDVGYIIKNLPIDHQARTRFVVKTFVGVGWRLFGEQLLTTFDIDTLRAYLGVEGCRLSENNKILFNNPFLIGSDPEQKRIYRVFEDSIVRKNITTIYMREKDRWFEWTISCLGYVVATIVVPMQGGNRILGVPEDKGILLTFGRHGMLQELLDASL